MTARTWVENMVQYPKRLRWNEFFKEGWSLFDANGILKIQGLDDPEPGQPSLTDGEAYALVSQRALEGSQMHALALYLDGKPSGERARVEIWVPRVLLEDDDAPGTHPLQQLGHEMRKLGNQLLEQDGPKIGVVKAKDLGDDWRAESHLKPFPPETAKTILKEMGE